MLSHLFDFSGCSSSPSSASSVASDRGEKSRSSSVLATSRAPPSLVEGMIWSAIQRRTVRIVTPVISATSRARRYSVPPFMSGPPTGLFWFYCRLPAARLVRGPLAAPADARSRSAPRLPGCHWLSENLSAQWPLLGLGKPGEGQVNGAIYFIFFRPSV